MLASRSSGATCARALSFLLALAFCSGLTDRARASTIVWSLTGTFDDGGTIATGSQFDWESTGGLASSGLSITTTAGPVFPGATYSSGTAFATGSMVPDGFIVQTYGAEGTTDAPVAVLSIEFQYPPTGSGTDPIVVGNYSFECFSFLCTAGGPAPPGTPDTRYFTSGFATTTVTPLPAALPLFASGVGFVGFLLRRRKRTNAGALASA